MTKDEETTLMMTIAWIGHAVINIQQERMRDVSRTQTIWSSDSQSTLLHWVGALGSRTMARDPYNERPKRRKQ